jgi:RNA polymerase sigma-70 factor (ECF subfamily)
MGWRTRITPALAAVGSGPAGTVSLAASTSAPSGSAAAEASTEELSFEDFVRGASVSLHRTAYLLTGSREAAQDVVQTALTRVYLAWDRHAQWDNPTAYARQVVVNTVLTNQRRRWTGEVARADLGDRELGAAADRSGEVADRDALRRALDALPLRQRTAVVLRHYLDLSEAQTAAEMGAPLGTIKSLTARGLDALRTQLQEAAS